MRISESSNFTCERDRVQSLTRFFVNSYDTEAFADLIDKILVLDPKQRLTASEALDHDWFWVEPFPAEPSR